MRQIKQTSAFKRDLKREAKGRHREALSEEFVVLVTRLAKNELLEERYHDHALSGDWKDHRDCHLRPDLVLIYRKLDEPENPDQGANLKTGTLQLIRLGSHSELGL